MHLVGDATPCVCTVLAIKEGSIDSEEHARHVNTETQQASHAAA